MKKILILLVLAIVASGCIENQPKSDEFELFIFEKKVYRNYEHCMADPTYIGWFVPMQMCVKGDLVIYHVTPTVAAWRKETMRANPPKAGE